jgi:hypothetical protein
MCIVLHVGREKEGHEMDTNCETRIYEGSLARGGRTSYQCSRTATWEVDVRRAGTRVTEKRCAWHRKEGMNRRKIEVSS